MNTHDLPRVAAGTGAAVRAVRDSAFVWSLCLVAAAAALVAACSTPAIADVPPALHPAAGERLALTTSARGVQVYVCRPGKDPGAVEWSFVAPEAELYDADGRRIGSHGAGPAWEAADGSRVVGSVAQRAPSPTGAIPWLLLAARSDGPPGRFATVTSIQRVNTAGGLAPRDGCSPDRLGAVARVQYSADYRFYAPR